MPQSELLSNPNRPSFLQNLVAMVPFLAVHVLALGAIWTNPTPAMVITCIVLYVVRMWGVTAGYHRYFSHRTFKTSRVFQFILAWVAESSAQKGILWWAGHHRHHHKYSDDPEDIHSPKQAGFWWSHVGWILSPKYDFLRMETIKDLTKYPELRFINRWHLLPPIALGVTLYLIGGWALLVWGMFVSTVALWHGTFLINSLCHVFGSRRYKTTDTSRNNLLFALITLGEGWHNNHHHYQSSVKQGFFWWEIDFSYYVLKVLSWFGIVWDLRMPPPNAKFAHLKDIKAEEKAPEAKAEEPLLPPEPAAV